MGSIMIDGKTYEGNCVSIRDGVVSIDGKVQDGKVQGVVEVKVISGKIERLDTDASVSCGEVGGNIAAGGSVRVFGHVAGNVAAGGSVQASGRLGGAISAGGSVNIG